MPAEINCRSQLWAKQRSHCRISRATETSYRFHSSVLDLRLPKGCVTNIDSKGLTRTGAHQANNGPLTMRVFHQVDIAFWSEPLILMVSSVIIPPRSRSQY